jgi:hypothetical protein
MVVSKCTFALTLKKTAFCHTVRMGSHDFQNKQHLFL